MQEKSGKSCTEAKSFYQAGQILSNDIDQLLLGKGLGAQLDSAQLIPAETSSVPHHVIRHVAVVRNHSQLLQEITRPWNVRSILGME